MPGSTPKSLIAIAAFLLLLVALPVGPMPFGHASEAAGSPFPVQFADIIYQLHPHRPRQLYIVAQSHRNLLTGENGTDTATVQAEIYRIGEWLIENRGVTVLLPEGYFEKHPESLSPAACNPKALDDQSSRRNDAALADRLTDPDRMVNAGMLLQTDFDLTLRQVEDRDLYGNVCRLLDELSDAAAPAAELPALAAALEYQQKKRSAVLLLNIAKVLEAGKEQEGDCPRNALLTVGLAHVKEIIDFLENGRARIDPLPGGQEGFNGYYCDLDPLKNNYGITIILPRTLAENTELRRLTLLN